MRKYPFIALLAICSIATVSSCKKNETKAEPTPPYVVNPRTITITHSGLPNAGREILFSPDNHMNSPSWDFGDGSIVKVEDGVIVSHVYSASGTYSVTVWAADSTSKGMKTVKVGAAFHDFRYSGGHTVGDTLTLSTTESVSASLLWDFGDGTTSTEVRPTHVYDSAGSYRVQLSVNGVAEPEGALYVRVFNAEDTVTRLIAPRTFRGCRKNERFLNSPGSQGSYFLLADGGNGLERSLGESSVRLGNYLYRFSSGQSGSRVYYFVAESNSAEQPATIRYDVENDSLSVLYTTTGYSEKYGKAPMAFEHYLYSVQR